MRARFKSRISGVHLPAAWYPIKFAPRDGTLLILKNPAWPIMPIVRKAATEEADHFHGWEFLYAALDVNSPQGHLNTEWFKEGRPEETQWASLASTGISPSDIFAEAH